MGGVKFSIVIDAPPERVFERLADVTTHPSWANPKADMTMEQTSGAGPGPEFLVSLVGCLRGQARDRGHLGDGLRPAPKVRDPLRPASGRARGTSGT
jgi:Polyketide cyclase / dehydrase and lipid transport